MKVLYKGVDISKYQSINWNKVDLNEIDFVIIRAGLGFKTEDKMFKSHIENAIKLKIPVGIYWFSYAGTVEHARQEAESCLKIIAPYKDKIVFPVFFDWENESYNYVVKNYKITPTKQLVSDIAIMFMETVKKAGYKVGNYNSVSYLNTYFDNRVKDNYDTWVAHVRSGGQPLEKTSYKGKYTIHQYSWVGRPSGFLNDTDMNYCYKDYINKKVTESPINSISKYLVEYGKEQPVYIKDYNLLSQGNLFLSPHFQIKEFKSPDSSTVKIDNRLIWVLERLFKDLNCSKMIINSGYRTTLHDKKVGGDGKGFHTKGQAADIKAYGKDGKVISAKIVCQKLCDYGDVFGIGYINAESVHVDTRSKVNIWYGDETKGVSLIKQGYKDFDSYFNPKKTLTINAGTWNIRQSPNTASKIVCVVKGGTVCEYTAEMNGWRFVKDFSGWISPKGHTINK